MTVILPGLAPRTLHDEALELLVDRIDGGEDDEERIVPVPRTDDELWDLIKFYWGVEIPRVACCADHVSPFQAIADAFFARYRVIVCKASRGMGGKSLTMAALSLTEAVSLRAGVSLLGGSGEQSRRVLKYMSGDEIPGLFWDHPDAPLDVLKGGFRKGVLQNETRVLGGGYLQALMASATSVRGPHPQRLRLDEADEMDVGLLDAAMGQPMSRGSVRGQTLVMSTHQHSNGTMTELIRRCTAKHDQGWRFYEWCYRENLVSNGGWLSDEQVEDKRADLTAEMWDTEVEGQEPNPGNRAINIEKCKAAFERMRPLGSWVGSAGEYIEIEAPSKQFGAEAACRSCGFEYPDEIQSACPSCQAGRSMHTRAIYSTGTDWAKKKDWTVITTIRYDVNPARVVAWRRVGRMDWPAMIGLHEEQVKLYGGVSSHDQTGIGDVIQDYMTVGSNGVQMVGETRYKMLRNYINAIEHGDLIFPNIKYLFDEHSLASVEDVYSSSESSTRHHLPDSIASGAIAWWGRSFAVNVSMAGAADTAKPSQHRIG